MARLLLIFSATVPLIHTINQYCVMKKSDLFAIKEKDLKFNKTVKFILSEANLRNQAMLYGGLDIYLRHILIILSGNRLILKSVLKLEKEPFSPWQHILNCRIIYSLKTDCNIQKSNECLTVQHWPISKFCSQKQETESFIPLVYAMKEMDWWPWYWYQAQYYPRLTTTNPSGNISIL